MQVFFAIFVKLCCKVCALTKKSSKNQRFFEDFLEQVMGVEPTSSAWKADVLAVVRHLQDASIIIPATGRCVKTKFTVLSKKMRKKGKNRKMEAANAKC